MMTTTMMMMQVAADAAVSTVAVSLTSSADFWGFPRQALSPHYLVRLVAKAVPLVHVTRRRKSGLVLGICACFVHN